MEEVQLIESIQRGNTHAFGILVDRYAKLCFSIAYRVTNDSQDAEDIVQEAFISAYEHIREFKRDAKFSTWLYRIALNKALAFKKKQNFFSNAEDVELPEEDEMDWQVENEKKVLVALKSLQDKERLIIDLYYYQDQSIKEIAVICGITDANVKVIMHRARKKMSDIIQSKPLNL